MSDLAAGEPPKDGAVSEQLLSTDVPVAPAANVATTAAAPAAASTATATAVFNQNIIVQHRKHGPGFFTRAIWYLFVGWWLTGFAIMLAWLFTLSVVLLPIAYLIIHKIPTLLTLRPRSIETDVQVDADGTVRITTGGARQHPFWQRALWFVFVGWWACGVAMVVGYLMCLTVILIPAGLMVFNRLPAVMTLQRN